LSSIKQIELLCPTRNFDTGIAAINHGADAVYIGYTRFGARQAAGNQLGDIEKLIKYAHIYHVKVYITLNTILYDNELAEVQGLIHTFFNMGADAIIVQDMGILEMDLPPIPLHASTQAHNTDVNRIKFLENVGFQRVILARELSISEIKQIRRETKIELEAFIHGALCVSYSGQCYFSHSIAGRSANRGECAQPCRSAYDLIDEKGNVLVKNKHLLSLKDLNLSEHIKALISAGVTSFKVEGRLKDISYVKNITSHYRLVIDQILDNKQDIKRSSSGKTTIGFTPDPERTFSRGYTAHFAEGRQRNQSGMVTQKSLGKILGRVTKVSDNWFTIHSSESIANGDGLCFFDEMGFLVGIKVNRVDSNRVYPLARNGIYAGATIYRNYDHAFVNLLDKQVAVRQIEAKATVFLNRDSMTISLVDEDGIESKLEEKLNFEEAKNPSVVLDNLKKQFAKTGGTSIRIVEVHVEPIGTNTPFFSISQINGWRRELIEMHEQNRIKKHHRTEVFIKSNDIPFPEKKLSFRANVSNRLAEKFYRRHGVGYIEPAFELQSDLKGKQIMSTRYCILHELGYCDGKKSKFKGVNLFLKDNNRIYPLTFDCKRCRMNVLFP
jgi:putative protease